MRQLLFPDNSAYGFLTVPIELGILTGLTIVMLVASRAALARLEMQARIEGKLTGRRD